MAQTENISLYGIFARAYTHDAGAANPFDVALQGIFTHEGGARMLVDGFYDGDGTYRLRFMPTALGRWTYRATIEEQVVEKGEFVCVPSGLKGPLRQGPAHPEHFLFSNGDPFYMMGDTAYNSIAAYMRSLEDYRRLLDYYRERNFNWVRFFTQHTTWPTHGGIVWPWGGTPEAPDFSTFSLETVHAAEGVVQELAARGMIASAIMLHPHDEPLATLGAPKMAVAKRHIRNIVARLGAYWNVVWNLANEWQRSTTFSYDQMDELGDYLHRIDPYQHLTACHHYGRFEFYDKAWTDMSSLQHRGSPDEINRYILQNKGLGKPVLNEEYGYEGDNHCPPNDPDNVRHDHWAIAMAGGYGNYGDKTKGPKIGTYISAVLEDARGTSAPDALRYLQPFMAETRYRHMRPANEFVSGCDPKQVFCLAEPGREYIVYMVEGQPVTVNLTHVHGTLHACWYNPRTGERTPAADVHVIQSLDEASDSERGEASWQDMARAHCLPFTPPDLENDWVLYLRKA